jgi:hypothetical protein
MIMEDVNPLDVDELDRRKTSVGSKAARSARSTSTSRSVDVVVSEPADTESKTADR